MTEEQELAAALSRAFTPDDRVKTFSERIDSAGEQQKRLTFGYAEDRNIPLLTALVQIRSYYVLGPTETYIGSYDDLEWLFLHFFHAESDNKAKEMKDEIINDGDLYYYFTSYKNLVERLMQALADDATLDPADVEQLSELLESPREVGLSWRQSEDLFGGRVPARSISVDLFDPKSEENAWYRMRFFISSAIVDLLKSSVGVYRCLDCGHPMAIGSPKQKYCSFRCKNRSAQRRAYARRFAEYKAVKGR
jgi:hypothetical protein